MLDSWPEYFGAALVGAVVAFYVFARHTYSYWERKGIPSIPGASYLFGHLRPVILQQTAMPYHIIQLYNSTSERFIGMYGMFRPVLLVRDPELVQNIMVKDFGHFTDRGIYYNVKNDPLSGHLFSLPGEKWKKLRAKLSPAFTSGKLKSMFPTFVDCGHGLQNHLHSVIDTGEPIDIRDISAKYAINIIASVAFGIQVDTIKEPGNDFRKYGQQIFASTLKNGLRFGLLFLAPKVMASIGLHIVDADVERFIVGMVKQNLQYRETNNFMRKDFFQLLIQLHRTGSSLDDQFQVASGDDSNQTKLTFDEMCAQALVFYTAGFETSSSTLSYCLFELARNPDIQRRVQHELDAVLMKHNGAITYEAVQDMDYLDCCLDETLRKYSILPTLNRECVKDYPIPGTKHIIEKGTNVFIPVFGLQYDPKYYPNPKQFDPDRFKDTISTTAKYKVNRPYLGFGDGPRNCIGMRMGRLQTKVGLMVMLQHYSYALESGAANKEIEFDPKAFILAPKEIIKLRIKRR